MGKACGTPFSSVCHNRIQKTGLSVQAPSSSDSDTLKVAIVVQQIMTELNEAVAEENKIMVIIKVVLK
jgi:hypothetical protein